jgi:hypothetical protein
MVKHPVFFHLFFSFIFFLKGYALTAARAHLPRGIGITAVKDFDNENRPWVHVFHHTTHYAKNKSSIKHYYMLNNEFRFHDNDVILPNHAFLDCYPVVSVEFVHSYFLVNQGLIDTVGLTFQVAHEFMTSEQQCLFRRLMKAYASETKGVNGIWITKIIVPTIQIDDDDDGGSDDGSGSGGSGGNGADRKENSVGKNKRFRYDDEDKNFKGFF